MKSSMSELRLRYFSVGEGKNEEIQLAENITSDSFLVSSEGPASGH